VADGKDTPMQHEQLPAFDPTLDQSLGQAAGHQLPRCDHAVLFFCQAADCRGRLPRCNAFRRGRNRKTLHRSGGIGHGETVPRDDARVVRER
jgi:hypothetical protein